MQLNVKPICLSPHISFGHADNRPCLDCMYLLDVRRKRCFNSASLSLHKPIYESFLKLNSNHWSKGFT